MLMLFFALISGSAHASSLDNLEVGGLWGTPSATDATAIWWNPAGMAAEQGTRFTLDGAALWGVVNADRDDPYGYGGLDQIRAFGIVPYAGVVTDFGVKNLGIGIGMAVPTARGGDSANEIPLMDEYPADGPVPPTGNPNRYAVRNGMQQALHLMLAGSYRFFDRVSVGAGVHYVDSLWRATLDSETLTIVQELMETQFNQETSYTEDQIEDPRYGATLAFGDLKDHAITFNAGLMVDVIPEKLAISGAYTHGTNLTHTGSVDIHSGCPPESDTLGRFGAETYELCYTTHKANGSIGYKLPGRVNMGVLIHPIPALRLELMGGWVNWGVYKDFEIVVDGARELNEWETEAGEENGPQFLTQNRLWARENRNSGWAGVDVKGDVTDRVLIGGRVLYDHHAVPTEYLSPNNFDADTLMVSGLFAVKIVPSLQIAASFTQHVPFKRVVDNSAYGVNLDGRPSTREEDRVFYPHSNGTYTSTIHRAGLSLRGQFDVGKASRAKARATTAPPVPVAEPTRPSATDDDTVSRPESAPANDTPSRPESAPADDTPSRPESAPADDTVSRPER